MWSKLPIKDRLDLMRVYKKNNYSYFDMINDYNDSVKKFAEGGKYLTVEGEYHHVYENADGDIMVNHPKEDKGKWDTINLTDKSNASTISEGVNAVRKWHRENPYYSYGGLVEYAKGGMIKRADGSYSKRGLWDNIRANRGSGKEPTPEMLEQERKIKAKYPNGGEVPKLSADRQKAVDEAVLNIYNRMIEKQPTDQFDELHYDAKLTPEEARKFMVNATSLSGINRDPGTYAQNINKLLGRDVITMPVKPLPITAFNSNINAKDEYIDKLLNDGVPYLDAIRDADLKFSPEVSAWDKEYTAPRYENIDWDNLQPIKPLDRYPDGGRTPIYVTDPRDSRLKAYNDSLNLHLATLMQDKLMGQASYKTNDKFKWNTAELNEGRKKKIRRGLESSGPIADDFQNEYEQFYDKKGNKQYNIAGRKEDEKLLKYYKSLGFTDKDIMYHSSPDIVSDKIRPIYTYNDGTALSPYYKKPVQPYIYKKEGTILEKEPIKVDNPIMRERPQYMQMRQVSMPEPIKQEFDINAKISTPQGFVKQKFNPVTRLYEPVYVESWKTPAAQGRRIYNEPSDINLIPFSDFNPQFYPNKK